METLPNELLQQITGYLGRKDTSALARTNHEIYSAVNPVLYKDNFVHDRPSDSCVLWAARRGRIETIKRAYSLGANLEPTGACRDTAMPLPWNEPPYRNGFASGMHHALGGRHDDTFYYLLQRVSNLDIPSLFFCQCAKWTGGSLEFRWWYPLHQAIVHRTEKPELAAALIARGAYLSSMGYHALCDAVQVGSEYLIDLLLQHPQVSVKDVTWHGETALHCAAKFHKDEAICRAMIRKLTNLGVPVDLKDADGKTALANAFQKRNLTAVEELLELGADPNAVGRDPVGRGPLHLIPSFPHRTREMDAESFQVRRLDAVRRLVEAGADINESTGDREFDDAPPLWFACLKDLRVAEYLLSIGARTDIPIFNEFRSGKQYMIAALLVQTDVLCVRRFGWSMSEQRVRDLEETVALLLQHGASIDEVQSTDDGEWSDDDDDDGGSALLYACHRVVRQGSACLEILLKHGTRRNVSLEHLQKAMGTYFFDLGADLEDELPDGNEVIQCMLAEFVAREYPEAVAGDNE